VEVARLSKKRTVRRNLGDAVPGLGAFSEMVIGGRFRCPIEQQALLRKGRDMRTKSFFAAAACAVAVAGVSAGGAFAGEVHGPPGTPGVANSGSGESTGAPEHSNSVCSYNGLNDMNPDQGQIDEIVQTPHNQGSPGDAGHGTCAGGTNPRNP
jgi:hypothetical protein